MPRGQANDEKNGNRRISLLFLLPIVALVLQFALIRGGYGEPYPALMMPGFTGTATNADGNITFIAVDTRVGFAPDGATEPLTLARLFASMPSSMRGPTAWDVFRPTPQSPSQSRVRTGRKAWLVDHLLPSRVRRDERIANGNPLTADTLRWLSDRMRSLYPDRRALWIEFSWHRETYRRVTTGLQRIARDRIAFRHVDFNR
jgi:hypothetical protein